MTWSDPPGRPIAHATAPAKPPPEHDKPSAPAPPPPPGWRRWLMPIGLALSLWLLLGPSLMGTPAQELDYTGFLDRVDAGEVERVTVTPEGRVDGELGDGEAFTTQLPPTALGDSDIEDRLIDNGVTIEAVGTRTSLLSVLLSFLPLILLVGVFIWLGRRAPR